MIRARNRDPIGVSDVIYDMIVAGLSPGPRSYHGLVVANVLSGDVEAAVISLSLSLSLCVCVKLIEVTYCFVAWLASPAPSSYERNTREHLYSFTLNWVLRNWFGLLN